MLTLSALLALVAWTLGPIGVTVAVVILIVGLVTDADDKPKLRRDRLKLAYLIGGISIAVMMGATVLAVLVSLIGL